MRWLVCCLLLPLSASAASVLLVPVNDKARVLADELGDAFGNAKLTVKTAGPGSSALTCLQEADRDTCLGTVGDKAKVVAVFVVSGALKGAKGTLTLEMLAGGKLVAKDSTRVNKGKVKVQMRAPIARLLRLLPKSEPSAPVAAPKLIITETPREPEPAADAAPRDAPRRTEPIALAPKQPDRDPLSLQANAPKQAKPKVAAWVVTGLAVVAAGTAATFGGLGLAGKSRLETAPDGVSALPYSEATALQQSSNTQLTIALGAGIGAGVSGVVAAILWGVE